MHADLLREKMRKENAKALRKYFKDLGGQKPDNDYSADSVNSSSSAKDNNL